MAVIPMKEDVGQELYTRDHGTVRVDKLSWMDGGYHIVLTPNGVYMHASGLPVKDEKELRAAFGSNKEDLEKAIDWFRNRHEQEVNPPRPIGFHGDGYPMFADGTVPELDDLYAFFKPGAILAAAIVALHEYKQRGPGGGPKEYRKGTSPAPVETPPAPAKKASGKKPGKGNKPAARAATG
jgi:hypothetical protein